VARFEAPTGKRPEVGEEITKLGRQALALPVNLASVDETAGAVRRTVEALGRLDVLVNVVGTDAPGTVEELDVAGWDRTLTVNLRTPFLLSKAAFPHMREARAGMIVNISSVSGRKGWVNASAYSASKFGLTGFTELLADEGKQYGIRAIVLYRGAMATKLGPSLQRSSRRANRLRLLHRLECSCRNKLRI
jgi:NAD(P)-dependent dehydrogenase (short-subunit alcohol dehydrogenase family)